MSATYDISWVDGQDGGDVERVVAVDAGGTKTFAVAVELATGELTIGRGGPGNADGVGAQAAAAAIAGAVGEACGDRPAQHGVLAVAGTNLDDAIPAIEAALGDAVAHVRFINDVVAAWGTVALGQPGVAMISGTGSHTLGVEGGVAYRVGGWGHVFGDEASAHWLGREAVGAVMRAHDGRLPETALTEALTQGQDVDEWLGDLYGRGAAKHEVAAFGAIVDAVAERGDPLARELLERAAGDLHEHLVTVLRLNPRLRGTPVGLIGSTWRSATLHDRFLALLDDEQRAVARRIETPPALGALALALRSVGRRDVCTPERFAAFEAALG